MASDGLAVGEPSNKKLSHRDVLLLPEIFLGLNNQISFVSNVEILVPSHSN